MLAYCTKANRDSSGLTVYITNEKKKQEKKRIQYPTFPHSINEE